MSRVVPSQVVAAIDRLFPDAAKQVEGKPFVLYMGNSHQLSAIVDLVQRIPDDLIILGPEEYSTLLISTATIKAQVEQWQVRGDTGSFKRLPGLPDLNPVTLIRRCLTKCPDEAASPGTAELAFITQPELRESIRLDISAANEDLANGQWKGCTVLAGSASEALLLWALQERENHNPGTLDKASSRPADSNPEKWSFADLIKVAEELQTIQTATATQLRQAKDFRNLIHPGRVQRLGQKCDQGTALAALAGTHLLIRDLTP